MYCRKWNKKDMQKTPACDLLIGGTTIFYTDSLLLTADKSDFKTEFWPIVAQDHIIYKSGNEKEGKKLNLINIYLRRFDYNKIPNEFKEEKK